MSLYKPGSFFGRREKPFCARPSGFIWLAFSIGTFFGPFFFPPVYHSAFSARLENRFLR